MVSSQFGNILKEFEAFFQCPLHPEKDTCAIMLENDIAIQLELDRYGLLLIGSRIVSLPQSRYRNSLIIAALKFNESTLPSTGIFGFSVKTQELVLFLKLDPNTLTPHDISRLLPPFINKARIWKETIAKNEIPSMTAQSRPKVAGLFGLIS